MRGHGIVGHVECTRDLARGKAIWLLFHQKSKCLQSCGLGQRGEGVDREFLFHLSRNIDRFYDSQMT